MKRIIISIVTALILTVLFALLVPRLLFKGDARWTYQNDAARVDVKLSGHLKRGRVGAEGADMQILQPEWLSNENYQGTVVLVPVSYRDKRCQIKLTPEAEEWGGDAALVVELRGRDFQHDGKRRPAWVCFRKITLNGQPVAAEKVVWLNKPFMLRYPLHSSQGITLTFDVCKPLRASDISFMNLLLVFSAFLLLSLFFAPLRRVANDVLIFINRKDIVKVLKDGYLHIEPVYRRSFWIIFGVLCFAFGFHTINFMWGNHEWGLLTRNQRWLSHAFVGRYMWGSVKMLISNGIYLPLIYGIFTFMVLACNAVLLCKYWRLERRVTYFVLCGLVLTVQPFTLCRMYFVNMVPEDFLGVTYILTALLLSEKVASVGGALIKKMVYSFVAIILINFALAMYPVVINTIAVAFAGRLLVQSFDWDGSGQQLKLYMRPCMISASNIILGVVSYKFAITFVFPMVKYYNTETLPLDQMPERLAILLKQCFRQLYEYDMPFLPQWVLWVFMGFTVILTLYVCCTGSLQQRVVRLILLFSALFATQTTMIIAKKHMVFGGIDFFGLVFFETLVTVLFVTRFRKMRNLSVVIGACVIFTSVLHDLDCLRVWKLGFDAEKMLWNRVLLRLETQKGFDPSKKYDVVQVGRTISMRPRYYTGRRTHDNTSFFALSNDPNFSVFSAHEFFYPSRFRRRGLSSYLIDHRRDYVARLKRLYQAGVLQKAGVWPKPNGLIVWKDIILFVTDGKELERYKRQFGRELGKK